MESFEGIGILQYAVVAFKIQTGSPAQIVSRSDSFLNAYLDYLSVLYSRECNYVIPVIVRISWDEIGILYKPLLEISCRSWMRDTPLYEEVIQAAAGIC